MVTFPGSILSIPRAAPQPLGRLAHVVRSPYLFLFAIICGMAARLLLVALSGNQPEGVLGGGSDATAYILLGDAISSGAGMNYLGQPTALRAPLYPMLLAFLRLFFGAHSLVIMRVLQSLAALVTAWICGVIAARFSGEDSRWPCIAVAVCTPTLLFFNSQILTETFTALFVSLFLYFVVPYSLNQQSTALLGMGVCAGVLLLLRFNTLFIPAVAALAVFRVPLTFLNLKRALTPVVVAVLCVSPWLIRNLVVFHGDILYSSQTGTTALQGALSPDGRTQADTVFAFQKRQGWGLSDIETNRPIRLQYPSETLLNRRAKTEAVRAWEELGLRAVPLLAKKIGYFWLSTDQLLETHSFSVWQRLIRAIGVLVYWGVLTGAIFGWLRIRKLAPRLARLLLVYCLMATVLHLPFTMNTRLRVPLIDPILCILAGIAWSVSPSVQRPRTLSDHSRPA